MGTVGDEFTRRVLEAASRFTPKAAGVATFIDQNRGLVLASSAAELAKCVGTSDATVIRVVQALGFAGLPELKRALAATLDGRSTPADQMQRTLMESGADAGQAIDAVLRAHAEGLSALLTDESRQRIAAAVVALHPARRIAIFGVGPSAHIAAYITKLLRRSGRRSMCLDATGSALADQLLTLHPGDALLVLAYGEPYREFSAAVSEGRQLGSPIVLVTDDEDSALAKRADVIVLAHRGRPDRVAIHAVTVAALEALALGLAACDAALTIGALDRLHRLRTAIADNGSRGQRTAPRRSRGVGREPKTLEPGTRES